MKITINKVWFDRRVMKPRWYCRIEGGRGVNSSEVFVVSYGCTRWLAYRRARRAFWQEVRKMGGVK